MKSIEKFLDSTVKVLNEAAGWILFGCMGLVVVNVLLRTILGRPILGAYEWVGILTSLSIGLGLAYCAKVDGHIMIDFIVEKFSPKVQKVVAAITGVIVIAFMVTVCSAIFSFAWKLASSGEVSPTTKIPFYIFVFIIGFCFIFLTAVLVRNLIRSVGRSAK
ncbi:MAG: TRAP transporter small permease [Saccharofermentanales bacterium]